MVNEGLQKKRSPILKMSCCWWSLFLGGGHTLKTKKYIDRLHINYIKLPSCLKNILSVFQEPTRDLRPFFFIKMQTSHWCSLKQPHLTARQEHPEPSFATPGVDLFGPFLLPEDSDGT